MKIGFFSIGNRLAVAFGALLAIQIVVGLVVYSAIGVMANTAAAEVNTQTVIGLIDRLSMDIVNIESEERGYVITGDQNYLATYEAALAQVDVHFRQLRDIVQLEDTLRQLDVLDPLVATKLAFVHELIELRKSDGFEAARDLVITDKGKMAMGQIRDLIDEILVGERALLAQRSAEATAAAQRARLSLIAGGVVAILLIVVAATLITRSIASPLFRIAGAAEQIGRGDLTVSLPVEERQDEIGILSRAFDQMASTMRRSTADISQAVGLLGSSAGEILASTTQMASGTAETATSINETTTTVEEVRQAAQLSAQKAQDVSDNAQRVAQVSQNGRQAVEDASAGMDRIRAQMETIAQTVVRLSEQSQSIGGIIATVTDLADQSNLLAVNAAIEAAKAGEQGRGFAVVAQEIKSLAEQSKQATGQVRAILNEVQKATSNAVLATEEGSKAVEVGVRQANQAGEAIRVLADTSREAMQVATQIVASSQQQVVGMNQIGVAMENINQAGSQNAISMKQMETAAQNLHQMGQKLRELTEQFKV